MGDHSDGGPQFSAANKVIQKWAEEANISHQISSACNPEGNGEAESGVRKVRELMDQGQLQNYFCRGP